MEVAFMTWVLFSTLYSLAVPLVLIFLFVDFLDRLAAWLKENWFFAVARLAWTNGHMTRQWDRGGDGVEPDRPVLEKP